MARASISIEPDMTTSTCSETRRTTEGIAMETCTTASESKGILANGVSIQRGKRLESLFWPAASSALSGALLELAQRY